MTRFRPHFILAAVALALTAQSTLDGRQPFAEAAMLFALASGLMTMALASPRLSFVEWRTGQDSLRPFSFLQWLGLGMVVMGMVGMWQAVQALTGPTVFVPLDAVALPFLLLLLLTTFGLWLVERWSPRTLLVDVRKRRAEYLLLVGILALALHLRLDRLDYYPPPNSVSWNDEAQIGKDAHLVLTYGARPWAFPLLVYPTALSFSILGENTYALRLVPDLWGFLTVVFFYLLAREMFSAFAAFAATFLFAFSRWHLAITRMDLDAVPSTFLSVVMMMLVMRGLRTKGAANFLWAGLLLGVGFYGYAAFKILPVFVVLLLVMRRLQSASAYARLMDVRIQLTAFVQRLFHVDTRIAFGLFVMSLSAIIALTPYIAFARREPQIALTERFSTVLPFLFGSSAQVAQSHSDAVLRNLQTVLLFFNYRGEMWPAVNIPYAPMLDAITGALFVLAFGYCALTFWRRDHLLLLAWFAVTVIGGGVLVDMLRSHRFSLVLPVVFLIIASLVDSIWWSASSLSLKRLRDVKLFVLGRSTDAVRSAPLAVMVLLLPLAAFVNYDLFFNQQIHRPDVRMEYDRDIVSVANAIANLPGKPYIYLFANWPFYTELHDFGWMAHVPKGRSADALTDVLPAKDSPLDDIVYLIVPPYDVDTLSEAVRDVYPQARIDKIKGPLRDYVFAVAQISQADRASARVPSGGLRVSYFDAANLTRPIAQRVESVIAFADISAVWQSTALESLNDKKYMIQWDGQLHIAQAGDYHFKIETWSGSTELMLDHKMILQESGRAHERINEDVLANLSAGAYHFRLRYTRLPGDFAAVKIRWLGPDGVERVMPPSVFTMN